MKLHGGDLREPQCFAATARAADGVVHMASTNDASAAAVDEAAAEAMLSHLHPGAAFAYTSAHGCTAIRRASPRLKHRR